MPIDTELKVDLIEKELVDIELIDKELVDIDLVVIDVLQYHEKEIISNFKQEVPTHVSGYQFRTSLEYVSTTLKVYVNGIKEKINQIQIDSLTTFTFLDPIDINLDYIEVSYVEVT